MIEWSEQLLMIRDAKLLQIYAGTDEIQVSPIARDRLAH